MIDLYTFGTPNGFKASIMLEETGLEYQVHKIDITKNEQFDPEFLKLSPNNKIPAIVDRDTGQSLFESIAILMYLSEKTQKLCPQTTKQKYTVYQWCLFQAAHLGPMLGQFGHFQVYAKEKIPYAIERYQNESQRLFGVMDQRLSDSEFLGADEYTIADIASWPWIYSFQRFYKQEIDRNQFPNLMRWVDVIETRKAVQKGILVPA